jgi:hypothetical protein
MARVPMIAGQLGGHSQRDVPVATAHWSSCLHRPNPDTLASGLPKCISQEGLNVMPSTPNMGVGINRKDYDEDENGE